jgi:hypothetical protein
MTISLKLKFERFFDAVVESILRIEDYLCLAKKGVHASEIALFVAAHLSFWWLLVLDVQSSSPSFRYILTEPGWCAVFGFFSGAHFFGVWVPLSQFRQVSIYAYAVVWFVWLVMVAYANLASLFVPLVFVMMCLSIYVSVRLSRFETAERSFNPDLAAAATAAAAAAADLPKSEGD